jgi:hypothetical protein
MTDLLKLFFGILASFFRSRAAVEAENLVLRQQINVLRRRMPKPPDLNNVDRFLFVWLYHWFPSVLGAVAIVRPGNNHSLAPCWVSGVLALAIAQPCWKTEGLDRAAHAHWRDEPR